MRSPVVVLSFAFLAATSAWGQAAVGQPFRVFFDWAKPELTRDAETTLMEVVAAYQLSRPSRIEVAGHTDRSGSDEVNLAASRRRAEAVKAHLAGRGIPTAVMQVSAHGERRPIVPTEDGVREGQNRRVEISFTGVSATVALTAPLISGDGSTVGNVTLRDGPGGLTLLIEATNLPPGVHGLHLHAIGRCELPDFASAGPHWNPTGRKHGAQNPEGHHAGDLPNQEVGPSGSLKALLNPVPTELLDEDGAALVIHASPDDYRTDPTGNSGARIACAAFTR